MSDISYPLAFIAGLASFFSPCVLPVFPSYLSFITGIAFEDLTSTQTNRKVYMKTLLNSIAFVSGFSVIFVVLGASSSFIGNVFLEYQSAIRITGGVVIVVFGLFISGILRLDLLLREKKFHVSNKPAGVLGTFVVGVAFAAGWTPCIGPILGAILLYSAAAGSAVYGFKLLTVYSLGLAIPFIVSSLALNTFLSFSAKLRRHMPKIMALSGSVLILFGILLITDKMKIVSAYIPDLGIKL